MKSLKLWVGIIVLGITATACSKSKGGGAAAPPAEQNYYLENGICYDKNDNRVDYSYCQDDNDNYGPYNDAYSAGRCVGYVYYADCQAGKGYRINCSRSNSLAVECSDPEAYVANSHEIVDCTYREYNHARYCGGSVQY